ncbi:VOC family protein [Chitinophaga sp. Mgbs1]|uniref:VOC family protein n=1 Tax=Chitinophaga solisilvae TaxID=1233460 RepID=A0A433W9S0_9BACT|nr:VOC family protein [Chitinophaga solisilvae]
MANTQTLRGFTTMTSFVADHKGAIEWYTALFGMPPYFNKPGYAEFRVGDYQHEFGLIDAQYGPPGITGGTPAASTLYWHVDDIDAALEKLLAMGATAWEPVTKRGEGFITASVICPYGIVIGLMYNQHYLSVLDAFKQQ